MYGIILFVSVSWGPLCAFALFKDLERLPFYYDKVLIWLDFFLFDDALHTLRTLQASKTFFYSTTDGIVI